jgi:hypothetical protein
MKLDLPTLGHPKKSTVGTKGSILGSLPKCFLTSSKYCNEEAIFLTAVHILPKAAIFNYLHLKRESENFINFT